MSLMPKIVRGSAMHALEQFVRLACALWITPRMVYYLGEAGFGLWGLLSGIFAHFFLLDLGLCTSLPRFLARAIGKKDDQDIRETASTGVLGMFIIAMLAQVAGAVVWVSLPAFLSEAHNLDEARQVVIALMVISLAHWGHRAVTIYLQSILRRDLLSLAAILRVLISTPLVAWALSSGGGLITVAWIHAGGMLAELLFTSLMARSFFPLLRLVWVRKSKARELLLFARWSYLLTTTERIRTSFTGSDIMIVAAILGAAVSGIYSLGQKLAFMYYEVAYAIVGVQLLSAFSHLDGADDKEGLERGFATATRIAVLIAVAGGGMLWAIGPAFMQRWVPGQAAEATPVLLMLILPHMLAAAQIPARHFLISRALHRSLVLTYLAGIIVNIGLTYGLVKAMGMMGAAVSTLVEMTLVYAVAMPWLVVSQAGLSWRQVAWNWQWRPFLRTLALMAPALWLARHWLTMQEGTYLHIIAALAALSSWFLLLLATGLFGREERGWLRMGLGALVGRAAKTAE